MNDGNEPGGGPGGYEDADEKRERLHRESVAFFESMKGAVLTPEHATREIRDYDSLRGNARKHRRATLIDTRMDMMQACISLAAQAGDVSKSSELYLANVQGFYSCAVAMAHSRILQLSCDHDGTSYPIYEHSVPDAHELAVILEGINEIGVPMMSVQEFDPEFESRRTFRDVLVAAYRHQFAPKGIDWTPPVKPDIREYDYKEGVIF